MKRFFKTKKAIIIMVVGILALIVMPVAINAFVVKSTQGNILNIKVADQAPETIS